MIYYPLFFFFTDSAMFCVSIVFTNPNLAFLFTKIFWQSWEAVDFHENIYFQKVMKYFIKGTNHSNQLMMSFVWREFSSMRWERWWKKIKECQALKLGDAPMHPKKYSRKLKRPNLGMPPCIPFSINNHQFVYLHAIFLSLHMICAMLGASHSLLFSLF